MSLADDKTAARLLAALTALAAAAASLPRPARVGLPSADELELEPVMLPRDAFFTAKETVSADNAIGRIAAEQITPYPPGIPVIVPGERITAELLEYLRTGRPVDGSLLRRPTHCGASPDGRGADLRPVAGGSHVVALGQ
jgi:arginine/lysine/ornithine decarboxylase